jgi:hypothetical protein
MPMSLFHETCKQFHDTVVFNNLSFRACMSFMSSYTGSLQKNKSIETSVLKIRIGIDRGSTRNR